MRGVTVKERGLYIDTKPDRWPHVGPDQLRMLWEKHAPDFIRLDNVDEDLPRFRDTFLAWLTYKGVTDFGVRVEDRLGKRAKIDRVHLAYRGPETQTEIALSFGENSFAAVRWAPPLPEQLIRSSAEATLDAMAHLLPVLNFSVDNAVSVGSPISPTGQIALVQVSEPEGISGERYLGACMVSASLTEAAAKATLAAINRRAEIAAAMIGA